MRVWIWDVEKNYTGQYRSQEKVFNRREILNKRRVTITDGIINEDDVITVSTWSNNIPSGILAAEHNGVFFGPYDIATYNVTGEDEELHIVARKDREFQDTFTNDYRRLMIGGQFEIDDIPVTEPSILEQFLKAHSPYSEWIKNDEGFKNLVLWSVAGVNKLSEVRSALSEYDLVVYADASLSQIESNGNAIIRRTSKVRSIYPTTILDTGIFPLAEYKILSISQQGEWDISDIVRDSTLDLAAIPKRADNIRYSTPDTYNEIGNFRYRRIAVGYRGLHEDVYLAHIGTLYPTKYLDYTQYLSSATAVYLDLERWAMQNTAVQANVSVPMDVRLQPHMIVTFLEGYLKHPTWRITAVEHVNDADEGDWTNLSLSLWQGNWIRYSSVDIDTPTGLKVIHSDNGMVISWDRPPSDSPVYIAEWIVSIHGTGAVNHDSVPTIRYSRVSITLPIEIYDAANPLLDEHVYSEFTYSVSIVATDLYDRHSLPARTDFITPTLTG